MQFSAIWPIDRTLSGITTLGQSGPGSDGNEGVLRIPQSSSITGTSPSDCLISYPGHSLGGCYPSAEVQSVYSTAAADWGSHEEARKYYIYIYVHIQLKNTERSMEDVLRKFFLSANKIT